MLHDRLGSFECRFGLLRFVTSCDAMDLSITGEIENV